MNSLQDIAYKSLLSKLPSDVVEKLQEKALERNLDKVLDAKKRRTIYIAECGRLMHGGIRIIVHYKFKNATKEELPFLMRQFPNDKIFDETGGVSLFNLLILKHKNKLKENEMFKDVLVKNYMGQHKYGRHFYPCIKCKIPPELITELYTNILGYKDLIEDINEVFKGIFTVCFKDEGTWKLINKMG